MEERRSEKIGWIVGFFGGLLWIPLLSVFWLFMNKPYIGIIGLILFVIGAFFVFKLSPWNYPNTKFYLLMIPIYLVVLTAIVLFAFFGWNILETDFPLWSFSFIIPMLTPFFVMGWKTWNSLQK